MSFNLIFPWCHYKTIWNKTIWGQWVLERIREVIFDGDREIHFFKWAYLLSDSKGNVGPSSYKTIVLLSSKVAKIFYPK